MCEDKTVLESMEDPWNPNLRSIKSFVVIFVRSVYTSYLRPRMSQGNSKVNMAYPDTGNL